MKRALSVLALDGLKVVLVQASIFIFMLTLTTSCGYRLQGGGSILPPDIKSVAVPLAEDKTTFPGAGLKLTEAVRERFERYGVVKLVDRRDEADAVFELTLLSLEDRVLATDGQSDISVGYDLVMLVDVTLKRRTGQILYRAEGLKFSIPYAGTQGVVVTSSPQFASGNIEAGSLGGLGVSEVSRGQREEALTSLVEEASRKIYLESVAADF